MMKVIKNIDIHLMIETNYNGFMIILIRNHPLKLNIIGKMKLEDFMLKQKHLILYYQEYIAIIYVMIYVMTLI